MRYPLLGLLLISAAVASSLPQVNVSDFTQQWFSNKVDHFDYQDDRTYRQRFWENRKYWDVQSGPVFIYICGEYTCSVPSTRLYPFMIGAEHNALLLVIEHRFYGASQLFSDWSTENLKLLSSEQALSDLAYFIHTFNSQQTNPKQFVVIGGSYPGALSAWFREKYPHLAVASWSSSGVVQPIVNFTQFDYQIYTSTVKSGAYCPKYIQNITEYVTKALTDESEKALGQQILDMFGSPNIRPDDFMYFFADIFVESVQYGGRTDLCDLIAELQTLEPLDALKLIKAHSVEIGVNPQDYCSKMLKNTTIDVNKEMRQWTYQYCTQFGFFQVPNHEQPMRSNLLEPEYWFQYCARIFPEMNYTRPLIERVEAFTGGFGIQGTNTFFVNGGEDPWQWAAMETANAGLGQIARVADCADCGHCVELYTPQDSDPQEVVAIRSEIRDWISSILNPSASTKQTLFMQ